MAEQVFDSGVRAATAFVLEEVALDPDLLAAVEASTPSEPTDVDGFTGAQDCWICLDTALRGALGEMDPADSVWYLLEPLFQSTSERLFGLIDVGSHGQERDEAAALVDPVLAAGVAAVDTCISVLGEHFLTEHRLDDIRQHLQAICP